MKIRPHAAATMRCANWSVSIFAPSPRGSKSKFVILRATPAILPCPVAAEVPHGYPCCLLHPRHHREPFRTVRRSSRSGCRRPRGTEAYEDRGTRARERQLNYNNSNPGALREMETRGTKSCPRNRRETGRGAVGLDACALGGILWPQYTVSEVGSRISGFLVGQASCLSLLNGPARCRPHRTAKSRVSKRDRICENEY